MIFFIEWKCLADQFLAIGFLIAAKSIFRFEPENRRFAEYFLIGSLISFNIAIIDGIIIRAMRLCCLSRKG